MQRGAQKISGAENESNMLRLLHDTRVKQPEATHLPSAHIIAELTASWTPDQMLECFGMTATIDSLATRPI